MDFECSVGDTLTIFDKENKCTTHYISNKTMFYSSLKEGKTVLTEGRWQLGEGSVLYRWLDKKEWYEVPEEECKAVLNWLAERELFSKQVKS